jgi:DNA-binding MarR family transcriptional regulator
VSDYRRPRSVRKTGIGSPSPAALGVVKVGPDFSNEFPDGDPAAAEAFATILRCGQTVSAELERTMLASFGAPQNVLNSLAVIEGAHTALTPSEISECTYLSSATMTGTLDALEYNGWVRRVPNPQDRRSVLVEITAKGQAVADQLLPGIRRVEQAVLGELTRTERVTLLKLLAKVLKGAATVAAAEPITLEGRRNRPTHHET